MLVAGRKQGTICPGFSGGAAAEPVPRYQPSPQPMLDAVAEVRPALDIAPLLSPAGDEKRGGDFYVIERTGSRVVVVVGDVMGKGEAAAPCADRARGMVSRRIASCQDPAGLLEVLNSDLESNGGFVERYVTACVMLFDVEQRSATWAFAGHLPPHWLDTGMPLDGASPGLPLGIEAVCGATSAERRPLRPNEGVVIFTDGLEDVVGPGGDRFGAARITHTLSTELHLAVADEVAHGLKSAACEFGGGELYDDMCIVAIRMR
jgi:sigma-B regulation protein RsbU (phosphoserine phosphatase)